MKSASIPTDPVAPGDREAVAVAAHVVTITNALTAAMQDKNVADVATGLVSLAKLLVGDDLAARTALARCMFETSRELVEAAEQTTFRTLQ